MECLHLLLAAGADINLRVQNESLNDSPLETAIKWDRYEDRKRVFPVLLRAGAAIPPNVAHPRRPQSGCGRRVRGLRARAPAAPRDDSSRGRVPAPPARDGPRARRPFACHAGDAGG